MPKDLDTEAPPRAEEVALAGARARVLVVVGHPRPGSLSHALADAYAEGAATAAAAVRRIDVGELRFARDVTARPIGAQPLEPDLRAAQRLIREADHLVFVYPTWWGTMPGLLKSFLDRVLVPEFAFRETDASPTGYEGLLGGRSAHLVTTMDTPRLVYRWLQGAPGHRAMARATLGFCGVGPVRVTAFGPARESTPAQRAAWLDHARAEGRRLAGWRGGRAVRLRLAAAAWLAALRLQFYPMAWVAYTLGAVAHSGAAAFARPAYWLGWLALFLLEAATVFANERHDLPSDRANRRWGPFTGGSRVLVTGRLDERQLAAGTRLALAGAGGAGLAALAAAPAPGPAAALLAALAVLALGYTAPPLRLSWRTLGELDVAATHGPLAVLCGWALAGGGVGAPLPWLLGLGLALAVLPSITLSGVPDHDADAAAGKRTIAVRFGRRAAGLFAAGCAAVSAALALGFAAAGALGGSYAWVPWLALPNAALVCWLVLRRARRGALAERIDGVMAAALLLTVWFGLPPLLALL